MLLRDNNVFCPFLFWRRTENGKCGKNKVREDFSSFELELHFLDVAQDLATPDGDGCDSLF